MALISASPSSDAHGAAPVGLKAAAGEYLSLRLGKEEYGIDLLCIQEIRRHEECTRIAGAPDHVRGVLNLRGDMVPIVDLRLHFGLPARVDDNTVTVVLRLGDRTVGAIVDSVSDVQRLAENQISPLPPFRGGTLNTAHIRGLANLDQDGQRRLLILLNIESLMQDLALAAQLQ
ncbi:chemotaxis protein CheW [Paucibacter sp. APW11]|uniref:Chemotaxis protein CheW n=1 Tax=Roseateles aquae TaxID=3077235 RepID=A0ABU3P7N5_9BURK|nr:chemotaxis protein CheW [Paucibacter sp. APW11]MDT8998583.1 chemotaxis protein CheW [Paucibacter sp. APW11]